MGKHRLEGEQKEYIETMSLNQDQIFVEIIRALCQVPYGQYTKIGTLGSRVTARCSGISVNKPEVKRILSLFDLNQLGVVGDTETGYLIPECARVRILPSLDSQDFARQFARERGTNCQFSQVRPQGPEPLPLTQTTPHFVSQDRSSDQSRMSFGLLTRRYHRVGGEYYRPVGGFHSPILAKPIECVHEFIIMGATDAIHCEWCNMLFSQANNEDFS